MLSRPNCCACRRDARAVAERAGLIVSRRLTVCGVDCAVFTPAHFSKVLSITPLPDGPPVNHKTPADGDLLGRRANEHQIVARTFTGIGGAWIKPGSGRRPHEYLLALPKRLAEEDVPPLCQE